MYRLAALILAFTVPLAAMLSKAAAADRPPQTMEVHDGNLNGTETTVTSDDGRTTTITGHEQGPDEDEDGPYNVDYSWKIVIVRDAKGNVVSKEEHYDEVDKDQKSGVVFEKRSHDIVQKAHPGGAGGYDVTDTETKQYAPSDYDSKTVTYREAQDGTILEGREKDTAVSGSSLSLTTTWKYVRNLFEPGGHWIAVGKNDEPLPEVKAREDDYFFVPQIHPLTPVKPKPDSSLTPNEQAYLPDAASPGSSMVATYIDPNSPGPSGVYVAEIDNNGNESYYKTVTDTRHHLQLLPGKNIASLLLFKGFDANGKPDQAAARCVISRDAGVPDTYTVPNAPSKGGALVRASSAYERGGSTNGIVSVQTRGIDPMHARLTLDRRPQAIQMLAASDRSLKARIPDRTALGEHTLGIEDFGTPLNRVQTDVVSLRAEASGGSDVGSIQTITVHVDGLPKGEAATMDFQVGGSAQLLDGGSVTSVPVVNDVAQCRVRGVRAGPALVRYHLRAQARGWALTRASRLSPMLALSIRRGG